MRWVIVDDTGKILNYPEWQFPTFQEAERALLVPIRLDEQGFRVVIDEPSMGGRTGYVERR